MRIGIQLRVFFVLVMAFLLAAAAAGPANFAAAQDPNTVQIHEGPQPADSPVPHNDTHVCSFHIHGFDFEAGATGTWSISNWPGGENVYETGTYGPVGASGEWYSAQMYDTTLNGFGHYRLDVSGGGGTQNFWIDESACAPAPEDGTITVLKYNDHDSDGKQDRGDEPLSGWTFTVKQGSTVIDSGQTGSDGTKSFSVPAGTYDVFETLQTGWTNTEPGDSKYLEVGVESGKTETLDFGNHEIGTGTITINKYNDHDGDGKQDRADEALSGWTFTVKQGQTTITSGSTDGEGAVSFTLAPGTYDVFETLKAGWTNTEPGDGDATGVVVAEGQTVTLDFGNQLIPTPGQGTISVLKYNDLNKDGGRDEGEPGLSGWVFTVKDGEGATVGTITTDSTGAGSRLVNEGSSYSVCETTQAGWVNSEPGGTAPFCYTDISVVEEETSGPYDFGNYQQGFTPTPPPQPQAGYLNIVKFNDLDRDGIKDANEPVLPGVAFQVRSGATTLMTISTAANGIAVATLTPAAYTIVENAQVGWTATTPGGATQQVSIFAGQTATLTFGNAVTNIPSTTQTQLIVMKYLDANANGARDTDEGLLGGFSFRILSSDGAVDQTITTAANGIATITNLPLGGYSVTEIAKDGYTNTDPGGNATKYFAFAAGSTSATLSFGNAGVKLPSTSTDPNAAGLALSLTLLAGIALMFVMARRSARLS